MPRPRRAHVTSAVLLGFVLIALPGGLVAPAAADLMVVGNDQKVVWDAEGNRSFVEVGGLPEGAVFTPGGRYLHVGNYVGSDDTGKKLKLPGRPASMRGRAR